MRTDLFEGGSWANPNWQVGVNEICMKTFDHQMKQ